MLPLLFIMYAVYMVMVGINGNAQALLTQVETEKQFLYWVLILFVCAVLWESPVLNKLAKTLVVLIVLGFLVHNNNYKTIGTNAKSFLSGL